MKKRILIGFVSDNLCHETTVKVLASLFSEQKKYEVKLINLLDYKINIKSNTRFNVLDKLLSNKVVNKNKLRTITGILDSQTLKDVFINFNPDIVISTSFYFNYIVSYYKYSNIISTKLISLISDYRCNLWWTVNKENVDFYLVKNDYVKKSLIKQKINSNKIIVSGIPIQYSQDVEKDILVKLYNLNINNPIYLFFSDNLYDFEYFKSLVKKMYEINIVFVCEKNKSLKYKCDNFIRENKIKNVVVLSFVKDVFNIMEVSDVVISNSSGFNLSYILAYKKPSILLPSRNSFEKGNQDYMIKNNFSVKVNSPYLLTRKVKSFLSYPFLVNSMKNKLMKIENRDFNKIILDLVDKN